MFLARLALAVCSMLPFSTGDAAHPPAIAAAADLKFALDKLGANFTRDTGHPLNLSFGSSGNFVTQIENGAPFELFLSADESYVFRLADQGLTRDRGVLYAVGRIVLFAPHGSPLRVDGGLEGLGDALADGRLRRFAIANPDHAPYGRAACAALMHAGLWDRIQGKLVLGENAAQATQFAASGASDGGILPLSLSTAPEVAKLGRFAPIPAQWHATEPLRQRMVLLQGAGETALALYRYLQMPGARADLAGFGFILPEDLGP